MLRRPEWHAQAACRSHPELNWFPERGEAQDAAVAVCAACPVADECRAAGEGERYGLWGGVNPNERRKARRQAA